MSPAAQAVWVFSLLLGLAGCSSSVYGPVGPARPFASALVYVATDAQKHAYVAGTTTGAFPSFANPSNVNMLFATQFAP